MNKIRQHYKSAHPEYPAPTVPGFVDVQAFQSSQQFRYVQIRRRTNVAAMSTGGLIARYLDEHYEDPAVTALANSVKSQPNKWLETVHFNRHLEGYNLAAMVGLVGRDYRDRVELVINHLRNLAWRARDLLASCSLGGSQVLRQLNKRKYSEPAT